jgi:predicted ATPase/class 3 adenylate cyclase
VRELPTGTVTFMFTDIEGSTALVQSVGDRFASLLEDHHGIIREAISRAGGIEVSTEGDAFFVVFENAPRAVEAAVAAQRDLARHDWPDGAAVRVRMGLHTGNGELIGDNYGGIDVHRAARIASAGHGGQILLSRATSALADPSLPEGVRLLDLGRHRMKDIEQPEELCQLVVEDLPAEFPPLRTLDARPNNLVAQLTLFVARDREVKEIRASLRDNRIVTLTGPGGTGKTRLALEIGAQLLSEFADGVFFVPLAPVVDPELVPSTVAQNLSVPEEGTKPILESVKDHLARKELLLVFDNFEQILEAARFVSEILTAAPQVKALATSRAPLRVYGEYEYAVPPMALPDPDRLPSLSSLTEYESVALFVERARAVKHDFHLTEDNAPAIAEICARLDGLPLAIELAAARIKLLGPQELLARLKDSLEMLTGGPRDLPERQQTLRGAIDWSYTLLDDDLRTLFRRLAAFNGGWTFDAAERICDPQGELGTDMFEGLERLVEHSLVRRFETELDESRFRMLVTIREFALDALEDCGEKDQIQRRHAEYFLETARGADEAVTQDKGLVERLESDHDNLRAALRWALDNDEGETALTMAAGLWRFWSLRAHLAEGRRWLTGALALPSAAEPSVLRGKAVIALGSITYWQNDFAATRRHYEDAVEIFQALGDRAGMAEALYNSGFTAVLEFDRAAADRTFARALELYEELGDRRGIGNVNWGLAVAAVQARDLDTATDHAEKCLRAFEEIGDWYGASLGRWIEFQIARFKGDWNLAREKMLSYLDYAKERDIVVVASMAGALAEIELATGDARKGVQLAGAYETLADRYGGRAPPPLTEFSDHREVARAVLSEEEIDEAWREGCEMSVDDVIAFAHKD